MNEQEIVGMYFKHNHKFKRTNTPQGSKREKREEEPI